MTAGLPELADFQHAIIGTRSIQIVPLAERTPAARAREFVAEFSRSHAKASTLHGRKGGSRGAEQMQALIVGLLLAGVSATSVVAFKHPHGYARLFPYLFGIVTVLFVGITLWHVAVEMTWRSLDPYLDHKLLAEAEAARAALDLPYSWIAIWYFGIVAFFWVNLRLPPFLQVAEENHETTNTKHSR